MKKKIIASIALAAASASYSADDSVTFLNWVTSEPSNKPIIESMIEQTGVNADIISSSWGDMQKNVFLRLRSGQDLDVYQAQARWLPTFANLDGIVDFNEVYGKDYLESIISPAVLASGQYQGKQYGLPWNTGSISLVSNTKVLSDAGITKAPVTIADFVDTLEAVKKSSPESTPYAMMTKNNGLITGDFQLWLWAHGGEIFDDQGSVVVNSDSTIAALKFMKNLIDSGLADFDVDRGAARRLFAQGNSAFYFDAPVARGFARDFSGQGEAYDQYVKPIETPVLEAGMTSHSMEWGHLLVMMDSDKAKVNGKLSSKSVSAKFISGLMMNDDVQLDYFKASGAIPVTKAARNNSLVTKEQFIVDWNKSLGLPIRNELTVLENSANFVAAVSEEVQSVLLGKTSAEEAAKNMEKRIERLLK